MKKKLSKQQLEVMKILWNSETPLIASDIVKKHPALNINTVQACLRVTSKRKPLKLRTLYTAGLSLQEATAP